MYMSCTCLTIMYMLLIVSLSKHLTSFSATMYMFVQNSKKNNHSYSSKTFFRTRISHFSLLIFHILQVRFSSASNPLLRIGEKWDLHGICKGITWDLQVRWKYTLHLIT